MEENESRIFDALKKYFRFESFKSHLQQDAIQAICKSIVTKFEFLNFKSYLGANLDCIIRT